MDRTQLKTLLDADGISPEAYTIDGGNPGETYVLAGFGHRWSVHYSERGKRVNEQFFSTESAACSYLLNVLRKDPTTLITDALL